VGFDDSIHANLDDFSERQDVEIPDELPLMAVRDVVVFNSMIIPLFVGRTSSVAAVNEALTRDKLLVLLTQRDATQEDPDPKDLYEVGMVSMIMRTLKLPDGRLKVLVQALTKAKIKEFIQKDPFFMVRLEVVDELESSEVTVEVEALMRTVREQTEKIMSLRGILSSDLIMIMNNIEDPGRLADLVASNLRLKIPEAQSILESFDSVEKLNMQAKIQTEAKEEMTKSQREYYLREQLQALKKELGDVDERAQEIEELLEKIRKARMPIHAKKEANKQLKRLEMMHPDSSEAGIIRTYLDWGSGC
jgi:ATP-dependent Lon protease